MSEEQAGGQQQGGGLSEGTGGGASFVRHQQSPSSQTQMPQGPQKPLFGTSPLQQWFEPNLHPQDGRHGISLGKGEYVYEEWDGFDS